MNLYSRMDTGVDSRETVCDLRSDTVTKPCKAMRRAMASAEVGDDVYGEDPTVNRLEQMLSGMLGKEAGLLLPSGTQSNLCAIMAHCGRGEEVVVGDQYHVFIDEAAGASVLAGVALFPLSLEDDCSVSPGRIKSAIKDDDPHCPVSRLLSLENTVHGRAIGLDTINASADAGRKSGLSVHLDGARFFNATTALNCEPEKLAALADTVSVCLSKGLGAPMGTVLAGPSELIAKARRHRKILGGGMRQAGIIAAAGLYGIEHNAKTLAADHARAEAFSTAIARLGIGEVVHATNMVFLTPTFADHAPLHAHLGKQGIKIGGQTPTIRMVFHKDIDDANLNIVMKAFESFSI